MSKKALDRVEVLLSRRTALTGFGAMIAGAACGGDEVAGSGGSDTTETTGDGDGDPGDGDPGDGDPGDGDGDPGDGDPGDGDGDGDPGDGDGDPMAPECADASELPFDELMAPIEHIIVLVMENRSFDHFFGAMQLVEQNPDVDGLDGTEQNPDDNDNPIVVSQMLNFEPVDPPHGWNSVHRQWNQGAMDGFVKEQIASNGAGVANEVMGFHLRADLPVVYQLADEFTLCDRYFCSLLAQTWPNRYYVHSADGAGTTSNTPAQGLGDNIVDACNDNGVSCVNYYDGLAAWRWGAYPISGFSHTAGIDEFFAKLEDGGLEQVVMLDPDFLSNDDHPSHSIELGQVLIGSIYQALANSQYWDKCLLVITYDEHGGFFDHVPPPTTIDANGPEFGQLGVRVPGLLVGPYVRKGCVNHTVLEHSSIPATICRKFGLEELSGRSTVSNDFSVAIEPAYLDDPQQPMRLKPFDVRVSEVMKRVGVVNSQPEVFAGAGLPAEPTQEMTARARAGAMKLLLRAQRLGVVNLLD